MVIAALRDGRKVVLAIEPGHRESTAAWAKLLRSLRDRGLEVPQLVVADGHLGIWGAIAEVFPEIAEQRCWNHYADPRIMPTRGQRSPAAAVIPEVESA